MTEPLTRDQLLAHAARCYRNAGLRREAGRCLEAAGRPNEAGLVYQHLEEWEAAARCFERAENWRSAARCHREAGDPDAEARCLLSAGDSLEAGWVLAHRCRRYDRARAVLAELRFNDPSAQLALGLARGRCELARKPAAAGRAVRAVILRLAETSEGPGRDRVMEWAMALAADAMDRPDLTAALFAAAVEAGVAGAGSRWERWAEARLGSTVGIWREEEEESA